MFASRIFSNRFWIQYCTLQVQSELSSGILSAFPSQEKQSLEFPNVSTTSKPSTPSTTTESSEEEETVTRKFVPSSKRTTAKPKTDRNKSLFDSIQFDDLTGLLPDGFKVRNGFTPKNASTTTTKRPKATESTSTTTEKSKKETKSKSSPLASLKYKIKFDDVSAFLPAGYKPPTEEPSGQSEEKKPGPESIETKAAPSVILSKAKPADISAFLPPGFKLETTTENNTKLESVLGKIQFKETNELLPPDFSSTTETPKSTAKPETSNSKVVFPSRPGGNKKPPPSTQKSGGSSGGGGGGGGKQSSLLPFQVPNIQKGWPVRWVDEENFNYNNGRDY